MSDDHPSAGTRLGRSAARLVRAARDTSSGVRPRARKVARQASGAARPAVAVAVQHLREHDAELKAAGSAGARLAASRVGPPLLRPLVSTIVDQLTRRPPVPLRDPNVGRDNAGEPPPERPRNFF